MLEIKINLMRQQSLENADIETYPLNMRAEFKFGGK